MRPDLYREAITVVLTLSVEAALPTTSTVPDTIGDLESFSQRARPPPLQTNPLVPLICHAQLTTPGMLVCNPLIDHER